MMASSGKLSEIHLLDDRYDYDLDEPTLCRASEHRSKIG
jgi:hypothetical protein